jgi:hypothetical protein
MARMEGSGAGEAHLRAGFNGQPRYAVISTVGERSAVLRIDPSFHRADAHTFRGAFGQSPARPWDGRFRSFGFGCRLRGRFCFFLGDALLFDPRQLGCGRRTAVVSPDVFAARHSSGATRRTPLASSRRHCACPGALPFLGVSNSECVGVLTFELLSVWRVGAPERIPGDSETSNQQDAG